MNSLGNIVPGYHCFAALHLKAQTGQNIVSGSIAPLYWEVPTLDDAALFDYAASQIDITLPDINAFYVLNFQIAVNPGIPGGEYLAYPGQASTGTYINESPRSYLDSPTYVTPTATMGASSGIRPIPSSADDRKFNLLATSNGVLAAAGITSYPTYLDVSLYHKY